MLFSRVLLVDASYFLFRNVQQLESWQPKSFCLSGMRDAFMAYIRQNDSICRVNGSKNVLEFITLSCSVMFGNIR